MLFVLIYILWPLVIGYGGADDGEEREVAGREREAAGRDDGQKDCLALELCSQLSDTSPICSIYPQF